MGALEISSFFGSGSQKYCTIRLYRAKSTFVMSGNRWVRGYDLAGGVPERSEHFFGCLGVERWNAEHAALTGRPSMLPHTSSSKKAVARVRYLR